MSKIIKQPPVLTSSLSDFTAHQEARHAYFGIVTEVLNLPTDILDLAKEAHKLVTGIGALYGSDSSAMLMPLQTADTYESLLKALAEELEAICAKIKREGGQAPSEVTEVCSNLNMMSDDLAVFLRLVKEAYQSLPTVGIKRNWSYCNAPVLCCLRYVRNLMLMQGKLLRVLVPEPIDKKIGTLCESYKKKINLNLKVAFHKENYDIEISLPAKLALRDQKKVSDIVRLSIVMTLSVPGNAYRIAKCKNCGRWMIGTRKGLKPPMYHAGTTIPSGDCSGKDTQVERKRKSRERKANK